MINYILLYKWTTFKREYTRLIVSLGEVNNQIEKLTERLGSLGRLYKKFKTGNADGVEIFIDEDHVMDEIENTQEKLDDLLAEREEIEEQMIDIEESIMS